MSERYDNTIYKLFFKNKKTIKAILSSITRIRLIIHIKDSKEAPSVDHAYIEDTKVEETTVADIVTTSHPVGSNAISIINLDASQVSIQQKRDNKHILSINNMSNIQEEVILAQYYSFLIIWEGVEDLPDNNKGEIDYMIISMEIKEEYKIYFTEFGEVNSI